MSILDDIIRAAAETGGLGIAQSRTSRTPIIFEDKLPVEHLAGMYTESDAWANAPVDLLVQRSMPKGAGANEINFLTDLIRQKGLIQVAKPYADKATIQHEDTHSLFLNQDLAPETIARLWNKKVPAYLKKWLKREPAYKDRFGPELLEEAVAFAAEGQDRRLGIAIVDELRKAGASDKATALENLFRRGRSK